LNYYVNQLGLDYDDKGQLSRTGKINENLLDKLNSIPFYSQKFPKSLGFEFVKEIVIPIIESFQIPIEDKLRTFTEHVALQISLAIQSFETKNDKKEKMLITGGGAYNDFLIEKIQFYLPEIELIIPSPKILEFKEALIFALLGVLKLRNEINVLKSVTGAKTDHSSGVIYKN
jgi:anhydro-N-acetylmuramic acid kinase